MSRLPTLTVEEDRAFRMMVTSLATIRSIIKDNAGSPGLLRVSADIIREAGSAIDGLADRWEREEES